MRRHSFNPSLFDRVEAFLLQSMGWDQRAQCEPTQTATLGPRPPQAAAAAKTKTSTATTTTAAAIASAPTHTATTTSSSHVRNSPAVVGKDRSSNAGSRGSGEVSDEDDGSSCISDYGGSISDGSDYVDSNDISYDGSSSLSDSGAGSYDVDWGEADSSAAVIDLISDDDEGPKPSEGAKNGAISAASPPLVTVITRSLSVNSARKWLIDLLRDGDDDVRLDVLQCSLSCPITMAPLQTPARGNGCEHPACFELEAFRALASCSTRNAHPKSGGGTRHVTDKAPCPVCQKEVDLNDIIVDGLLLKILEHLKLSQYSDGDFCVNFFPTGHWQPVAQHCRPPFSLDWNCDPEWLVGNGVNKNTLNGGAALDAKLQRTQGLDPDQAPTSKRSRNGGAVPGDTDCIDLL